jgi:hypothetical protein
MTMRNDPPVTGTTVNGRGNLGHKAHKGGAAVFTGLDCPPHARVYGSAR